MDIKENLEKHYLLEFPSSSIENDELADCHAEMAEVDGFVVGSISSGTVVSDESKNALSTLEESLSKISGLSPSDAKIKLDLMLYLESLKRLIESQNS